MGISNSKCDELTNKNNKLIQDIKNEENLKIRLKNWLNKAHKECQSVNGFSKSKSLKEFKCLPNKDKSVYHKLILADKELLDQWTNIEKEIKKINAKINEKNKLKLEEQSKINQKNCDLLKTESNQKNQPKIDIIVQTYDAQIKKQQTTMRTQNTDYLNQCKNDPIVDEHRKKITDTQEQCQTQKKDIFKQNKQTLVDAIADCDKQVIEQNQQNVIKVSNIKDSCKSKVPDVKQNAITDANNEYKAKYPAMCSFDNPIPYSSGKNGINDYCCPDDHSSVDRSSVDRSSVDRDITKCKKCTDPNGCVENTFYRELTDLNIQDRITALKATLAGLKNDKSQLQTNLELKKQKHTELLETQKSLNEELTYIEENGERNMNELVLKKQEKAINAKAELNQKKNELLVINVKVPDDLKQQIQTLEQETLNVNTLSKNVISKYQTETQTLLDNKKPDTGTADKRTTVLSEFLDYDSKVVASMGPITNLRVELASTINAKKEKVDEIKSEIKSKSDILKTILTNRKDSFSELLSLNNVSKNVGIMINKLFIMDLTKKDKNSVHKSIEKAKIFKKTMVDLKVAQTAAMEKIKEANDKLTREQASAVAQKAQALAEKNRSISSAFALKQAKEKALNSLIAGGWENSQFFDKADYERRAAAVEEQQKRAAWQKIRAAEAVKNTATKVVKRSIKNPVSLPPRAVSAYAAQLRARSLF